MGTALEKLEKNRQFAKGSNIPNTKEARHAASLSCSLVGQIEPNP